MLESYEPWNCRQEEAYDYDGIAIRQEIGIHTQHEAREQGYDLALLLAIDKIPSPYGAEENGHHQGRPSIHPVSPGSGTKRLLSSHCPKG
jgi:hypothetical protein